MPWQYLDLIWSRIIFFWERELLNSFQLAKEYHPDVNKSKDANARFQEVSEAYEVGLKT